MPPGLHGARRHLPEVDDLYPDTASDDPEPSDIESARAYMWQRITDPHDHAKLWDDNGSIHPRLAEQTATALHLYADDQEATILPWVFDLAVEVAEKWESEEGDDTERTIDEWCEEEDDE